MYNCWECCMGSNSDSYHFLLHFLWKLLHISISSVPYLWTGHGHSTIFTGPTGRSVGHCQHAQWMLTFHVVSTQNWIQSHDPGLSLCPSQYTQAWNVSYKYPLLPGVCALGLLLGRMEQAPVLSWDKHLNWSQVVLSPNPFSASFHGCGISCLFLRYSFLKRDLLDKKDEKIKWESVCGSI